MKILTKLLILSFILLVYSGQVTAQSDEVQVTETNDSIEIQLPTTVTTNQTGETNFDPMTYTLGADDIIEISVMRHPEFTGIFPINKKGVIQYEFVGDIDVKGMTKQELEVKIADVLSVYVNNPQVTVTIIDFKSKVFYVLGEVTAPGKYYMRSENIPVREAVFEAGLPTHSAAMRKCQIITPTASGEPEVKKIDLYSILYAGNLKKNINLRPGDVLYVPSTVMAKIIRVISPAASTVGIAASGPESVSSGKRASETLR
ncbi:MAG: polysaccharide biosynthesis/export family protein [Candidatus Omnitrophota bacterium]